MIKNDIVKNFRNIKNEELEQLSNNIYISATLKAYNIDSKEIIKQLMYRNHLFTSYMDEKGIDIDSNLSNLDAEDLIAIYKKHLKIIKERI